MSEATVAWHLPARLAGSLDALVVADALVLAAAAMAAVPTHGSATTAVFNRAESERLLDASRFLRAEVERVLGADDDLRRRAEKAARRRERNARPG